MVGYEGAVPTTLLLLASDFICCACSATTDGVEWKHLSEKNCNSKIIRNKCDFSLVVLEKELAVAGLIFRDSI